MIMCIIYFIVVVSHAPVISSTGKPARVDVNKQRYAAQKGPAIAGPFCVYIQIPLSA
jgi:hypothetical protein